MPDGLKDVRTRIPVVRHLIIRRLQTGTRCRIHRSHGADLDLDVNYLRTKALPFLDHRGGGP